MFNLSTVLEHHARNSSNKEALIFADKRITFSQLDAAANQIANGLVSLGIGYGDKVALTCPNLPYFPMIYFGILKTGATVVPLSVLLKRHEIAYHLQDSDAKAYFCFVGTPEMPMGQEGHAGFEMADSCEHFFMITPAFTDASPIEATQTMGMLMAGKSPVFQSYFTSPDDTAVIIYTSGTTGRPKGAELTHSNLFLNANLSKDLQKLNYEDVSMLVLPLFHIFGQVVCMIASIYRGATAVLVPRFDAEMVLSLIQKEKVTHFAGVPTMYWGLLSFPGADKFDTSSLSMCLSGGAALPVQVLKDFEAKYNVPILEGYGMSEGSPVVTFNHPDRVRKPGSVGTPVWGVEVCIKDENGKELGNNEKGELCYRGHNVMKGYYKRPDATAESIKNGWLHSGDIAIRDDDGYYFIVDRTKDMIIRGGYNVYPREVEEVMMQHSAISMVAVIGVPSDEYGEEIKACVVLKPDDQITEQELIVWTKERIASYKYPRVVEFMSSLPMGASGKILKRELRK
ncbi:AMP-dependent synthetase and ligase [Emticicia oligotrophica DSM 17448]|uniref:AMP-dependent synthetase and ligase n=1 Tax=Emticicia oligotrophica (strain DSM 17448 / CIP 109782 / MTCC 6937 / GPTSA100-15) TaxID=929562 RepID=A0ABN4AQ39_EMTOG|nr:long-chain fatty acid--CoA ligase [Emticicia oligotrophica]AFK03257.1 AMP-dependent synthetase and ligase [Emticicia oligotrophica DSM 17448]